MSKLKLETEKKQLSTELNKAQEDGKYLTQTLNNQKKKETASDLKSSKLQLDLKAKMELLEKMQKEEVSHNN